MNIELRLHLINIKFIMKAVTILRDEENQHKLIQIDVDEIAKDEELIEYLF
jgi:hypothetical protein